MNEFRFVVGATREIRDGLSTWISKIDEYLNLYYQGEEINAFGTDFFKCISKTREIESNLFDRDDSFRGVIDDQNLLAAVCLIQETSIIFDGERLDCLELESLTNSPWNTIDYPQVEKRKGAATSLLEGIVRESQASAFSGIVKLMAIPSAREFYQEIGFIDTDGSGEMILIANTASMFLLTQEQNRELKPFD
ncbi:hypothetical protein DSM106972_016270 [Dulcicalothrix desertica PCC 7102]|uniref:N-acetyltransferase domain-containing protein n=1 Tax=Dulcicalothrix desertica PCC 7102 TaxID=232991 RepID=A0A433VQU9_9CYAN|nr:hypothetical protein [Dulcicalothrix desertica]RUT08459.1 hypothetical protein DSM106972_016270 [Dulcicalothrix desertica PCC 7102]TWH40323.1 hypothetical protein CAL7102_09632 [Dulcicalothrix desertica PCC 7102]